MAATAVTVRDTSAAALKFVVPMVPRLAVIVQAVTALVMSTVAVPVAVICVSAEDETTAPDEFNVVVVLCHTDPAREIVVWLNPAAVVFDIAGTTAPVEGGLPVLYPPDAALNVQPPAATSVSVA